MLESKDFILSTLKRDNLECRGRGGERSQHGRYCRAARAERFMDLGLIVRTLKRMLILYGWDKKLKNLEDCFWSLCNEKNPSKLK